MTPRPPDVELYRPTYQPWEGPTFAAEAARVRPWTLLDRDSLWHLWQLAQHATGLSGEFWECGVFRGGSALLLSRVLELARVRKPLRLFDTFAGIPSAIPEVDCHRPGDFAPTAGDSCLDRLHNLLCHVVPGVIPETFAQFEQSKIAFCHCDLDVYASVRACVEFVWPRLTPGGVLLYDDYGHPTTWGARKAADEFHALHGGTPLVLSTGQAFVIQGG